jgi:hypothetical protein
LTAAVIVYDWSSGQVACSTFLENPIQDMFLLQEIHSIKDNEPRDLENMFEDELVKYK